jgi:large subunit ribosomal protein L9
VNHIQLILTESVHNLGEAGDLVSVKPGYARNFLLRQGKAILATESRVLELEHHKRIVAEKAARALVDLRATKQALEAIRIEISARAGEAGKLFGSVTSAQIADQLVAKGFAIDRRRVELREPIKEVGEHAVPVKLHREIVAKLVVTVIGEAGPPPEEEAEEAPAEDRRRRRDDDRETSRSDDEDEDE